MLLPILLFYFPYFEENKDENINVGVFTQLLPYSTFYIAAAYTQLNLSVQTLVFRNYNS